MAKPNPFSPRHHHHSHPTAYCIDLALEENSFPRSSRTLPPPAPRSIPRPLTEHQKLGTRSTTSLPWNAPSGWTLPSPRSYRKVNPCGRDVVLRVPFISPLSLTGRRSQGDAAG